MYPDSLPYVSDNKAAWEHERALIGCGGKEYSGAAPAFVYNSDEPEKSEFRDIAYKFDGHSAYRVY